MSTLEVIVDEGLGASFDAGGVVTHGVEAGLGGVHLDDGLKSIFATGELILVMLAHWLAFLENEGLWVFTILDHLLNI